MEYTSYTVFGLFGLLILLIIFKIIQDSLNTHELILEYPQHQIDTGLITEITHDKNHNEDSEVVMLTIKPFYKDLKTSNGNGTSNQITKSNTNSPTNNGNGVNSFKNKLKFYAYRSNGSQPSSPSYILLKGRNLVKTARNFYEKDKNSNGSPQQIRFSNEEFPEKIRNLNSYILDHTATEDIAVGDFEILSS